jgi:hypothetical protein
MNDVEILPFLLMIEAEGCIAKHQIEQDGRRIQYYLSWNKTRTVAINITFDTMTRRAAKILLIQLELEDIIPRLGY